MLKQAIATSILIHAAAFGVAGFNTSPAQYNVVQAPTSIEVVMVKTVNQSPVVKEQVFIKPVQDAASSAVTKENIQPDDTEENPVDITSAETQGALTQATPDGEFNEPPVYPYQARRQGQQGLVVLKVNIDAQGEIDSIEVLRSSGHDLLDKAALKAVKKWRFKPASLGGITLSSSVTVPIKFKLD